MKAKIFAIFLIICVAFASACANKKEVAEHNSDSTGLISSDSNSSLIPATTPQPFPGEDNILQNMTPEEYYEVNIFLSNFSETGYNPDANGWSDEENKINFAFYHAKYNSPSLTFMQERSGSYYEGISAKNVDSILNRFFGSSVPHETPENSYFWVYDNGNFVSQDCEGDGYMAFSIATSMSSNEDGTYEVEFDTFSNYTKSGMVEITKDVYSYTADKAAEIYGSGRSGRATLKPKVYNGENTYELINYELYMQ